MIAYLVLVLAALSRFLPHAFHGTGLNFTAVGAGLLFFGARRPRWQAVAAVAVMAATDVVLNHIYGVPFHVRAYLVTWAWYGAVCLLASGLLRRVTALRVAAGVLASATSFFLLSNFAVWAGGGMYPHSAAGLGACFYAALPFYANDLISTALVASVLFGVPVLAAKLADRIPTHGNQPLA